MQKKCEKCRTTPDLMFHETGVYASGCPVDGKYAILARRLLGKVLSGNGSKVSKCTFPLHAVHGIWGGCQEKSKVLVSICRTVSEPDFHRIIQKSRFPAFRSRLLAVRKRFSRALSVFVRRIFFAFKRLKNHSLEIKC